MHVARRFERFLETYRRLDGARWGGADLERATGGVVTRSYVTNLRNGCIENPGYEKMSAIAKAMGFPPEARRGLPLRRARTSPRGSRTCSRPTCTRGRASPTRTPRWPA